METNPSSDTVGKFIVYTFIYIYIYTMVMSYIKGADRCIFMHIHPRAG